MKCFFITVVCLALISTLNAQSRFSKNSPLTLPGVNHYLPNATVKQENNNPLIPFTNATVHQQAHDNCVLKLPAPALTFVGKSFGNNIYQSSPDNMYVIKPDSSLKFNMPVAIK